MAAVANSVEAPISGNPQQGMEMNNRNGLYFLVGALLVVVIGMGIYIFREETKPAGVDISIGEKGISVQEK
ncbi:hypothetical protein A6U87_06680 [Rhizobium sp. AC44/96]|jgi:hypothetical protein|nr:hypothetical protein A6U87_06680 [Rhizobium sp. AC44/96]